MQKNILGLANIFFFTNNTLFLETHLLLILNSDQKFTLLLLTQIFIDQSSQILGVCYTIYIHFIK